MSTQLLTVSIAEQEQYLDLLRMRARQLWDEVKHGSLHADVLIGGGGAKREAELMDEAQANYSGSRAYFGLTATFPRLHPLARAAQNYHTEAGAGLGIRCTLEVNKNPLAIHENLSQYYEELMHFMEGKYQMDMFCLTPEDQKPVERTPWISSSGPPLSTPEVSCLKTKSHTYTMKVYISQDHCIACGLCREVCPVGAIHSKLQDFHHWLEVVAAECTGDSSCLQYCPAPGALVQYEATSASNG